MRRLLLGIALSFASSVPALAHDTRPAYLELMQSGDGAVRIFWREPVAGDYALNLVPQLSTGWLALAPVTTARTSSMLVREWRIRSPHVELEGATVSVAGLDKTITDVLLHVTYRDGTDLTQLITPWSPSFLIPPPARASVPVKGYLWLGFTHIWSGADHLLYILGLTLLVRNARSLLKTITGFTLAHSVTLAAAALGIIHVPSAPVEACIALSIIYVGTEVIAAQAGRQGIAQRAPWSVAFCFGLLHGLGFAGALAEFGLPPHHVALALLLFNAGIEIGQISFVVLLLCLARVLVRTAPRWAAQVRWAPPYLIGGMASFWFLQRVAAVF